MTDGKRILRNGLLGFGAGFLLGMLYMVTVPEYFHAVDLFVYGLITGIGLGLLCLVMTATATKLRNINKWLRRSILIAIAILGAMVFFLVTSVLLEKIYDLLCWKMLERN